MENSKKIVIEDFENKVNLSIRLFDAEKGLDFVEKVAKLARNNEFSIKTLLDDLLPLVSLLDTHGDKVVKENLTRQDCYGLFQNPLSIIDLGMEVFEFQMVFIKNSKAFRPLAKHLENIFNIMTLESETK